MKTLYSVILVCIFSLFCTQAYSNNLFTYDNNRSLQEPGIHKITTNKIEVVPGQNIEVVLPRYGKQSINITHVFNTENSNSVVGTLVSYPNSNITVTFGEDTILGTVTINDEVFEFNNTSLSDHKVRKIKTIQTCDETFTPTTGDGSPAPEEENHNHHLKSLVTDLPENQVRDVVNVLVEYSDSLVTKYGSEAAAKTRIDQMNAYGNAALSNSNINMQYNIVGYKKITINENLSMFNLFTDLSNKGWDYNERVAVNADLIVFIRPFTNLVDNYYCGVANLATFNSSGVLPNSSGAIVFDGPVCYIDTFVHELGHNSGLAHDRGQQSGQCSSSRPYACGYSPVDASGKTVAGTVMSYVFPKIQYFSNPDVMYNNMVVGKSETATDSANNAKALVLNKKYISNFRNSFTGKTVNTYKNGNGTITSADGKINCGNTCLYVYSMNTNVILTATPDTGYTFGGWSGDCSGTTVCPFNVDNSKSITANFTKNTTVQPKMVVTNNGGGVIRSSPSGINCGSTCSYDFNQNTVVSLTATPDTNYSFSGWSGPCAGTGICDITLFTSDKTVTANFTQTPVSGGVGSVFSYGLTTSGTTAATNISIYVAPVSSDRYKTAYFFTKIINNSNVTKYKITDTSWSNGLASYANASLTASQSIPVVNNYNTTTDKFKMYWGYTFGSSVEPTNYVKVFDNTGINTILSGDFQYGTNTSTVGGLSISVYTVPASVDYGRVAYLVTKVVTNGATTYRTNNGWNNSVSNFSNITLSAPVSINAISGYTEPASYKLYYGYSFTPNTEPSNLKLIRSK